MLKINEKTKKALIAKVASLTPDTAFPVIVTYTNADDDKVVEAFEVKFFANTFSPFTCNTCKNIYRVLHLATGKITPFESAIACENYDAAKLIESFCNHYLIKYFALAKKYPKHEPKYKIEFNPVSVDLTF